MLKTSSKIIVSKAQVAALILTTLTTLGFSGCALNTQKNTGANFDPQKELGEVSIQSMPIGKLSEKLSTDVTPSQDLSGNFVPEGAKKDIIDKWINYYTVRDRDRFIQHLKNGNRYRSLVESIFKQYALPQDLYYLGIIESGYNLKIKSRAHAVGPWQFMKGTAIRYGLKVNQYTDERRNIFKSTHAAAMYLRDLYAIFSDWELALAAYNAGEYKIIKAIRKGKSREYDILTDKRLIPKETRNYLPKLLAVKTIEQNLNSYGFDSGSDLYVNPQPTPMSSPIDFHDIGTMPLKYSIAVADLLPLIQLSEESFHELNPDIKGPYIFASNAKPFVLHLPTSLAKDLSDKLVNAPLPKITIDQFKLLAVYKIDEDRPLKKKKKSRRYRNDKRSAKIASLDHELSDPENDYTPSNKKKKYSKKTKTYRVKKGDSLAKIASRFGVSVDDLRSINGNTSRIYPNQKIDIISN
ncbi:MAG: transglycosylase SLT domain-containing protein [Oligoflexia bacterium]|nr:transglycosylase SLT domain-containing protein [Oligoflexia bacterium]